MNFPENFQIIPVIDLKMGLAVHARAGKRESYAPLHTSLCESADPHALLEVLLRLAPFPIIYLADLDAIMSQATRDQHQLTQALARAAPDVSFWLDAGITEPYPLAGLYTLPNLRPVIGSENLRDVAQWRALQQARADIVLSLDYQHGRLRGPDALAQAPELWPEDIIIMELDRVGTGSGPNVCKLTDTAEYAELRSQQSRRFYAAGGVRHADDITALQVQGISGALVATALYSGTLDRLFR